MRIEKLTITGVNPKTGIVKDGGSVVTNGFIRMSTGEGCGLASCHCSDDYWLSIGQPVKIVTDDEFGAIIEVIKVTFDGEEEMDIFLHDHEILGSE